MSWLVASCSFLVGLPRRVEMTCFEVEDTAPCGNHAAVDGAHAFDVASLRRMVTSAVLSLNQRGMIPRLAKSCQGWTTSGAQRRSIVGFDWSCDHLGLPTEPPSPIPAPMIGVEDSSSATTRADRPHAGSCAADPPSRSSASRRRILPSLLVGCSGRTDSLRACCAYPRDGDRLTAWLCPTAPSRRSIP